MLKDHTWPARISVDFERKGQADIFQRHVLKLTLLTIELIREPILVDLKNYTADADIRYRASAASVLYYYTRREAQRVANCEAVNLTDCCKVNEWL